MKNTSYGRNEKLSMARLPSGCIATDVFNIICLLPLANRVSGQDLVL